MDKSTKRVIDEALKLPEFELAVLVRQLIAVLDGGDETEVLEAALKLPEGDRWEVIGAVLPTLDEEQDYDLHPSWREEIARRLRQIEGGEV